MKLQFDNPKLEKTKYQLFIISTFTLAAIITWVGYSLYDTFNTSTIVPEVSSLLTPLDPSLDREVIETLANRFEPPEEFSIIALQGDNSSSIRVRLSRDAVEQVVESNNTTQTIQTETPQFQPQNTATNSGLISE